MPGEEETCRKRHGQPLMRIESNRIGLLNSAYQAGCRFEKALQRHTRRHVEPDVVATTNFMNPRYVVDRA